MSLRSELAELVVDWVADGSRVGYDGREQHENDYLSGTVVPVLRELLDRHPEPVGVELTEAEGPPTVDADLLARAIRTLLPTLRSDNFVQRWSPGSQAVRALDILIEHVGGEPEVPGDLIYPDVPTAHACRPEGLPCPAPTVALDVWTCMDALAGLEGAPAWWGGGEFRDAAEKVVAADPRRTEAEVKAEARKRIALAIADSVPYGCELRHDGTEDPIAAAYVQALGDAIRITEGATDE